MYNALSMYTPIFIYIYLYSYVQSICVYVYTDTKRMALHVINNNAPPLTRNEIAQVRNEGSSQPLRVAYTSEVTSRDPGPSFFFLMSSSALSSLIFATDRTYPILKKWRLVVLVATKRVSYKKVKTDCAGT